MPVPLITDYISIAKAVILSGLTRAKIVELIGESRFTASEDIVSGRIMILKSSFDTWLDRYTLANRSLTDVLTETELMQDGVSDYLVATFQEVDEVEFTDIDEAPRVLANSFEFYESVKDTAIILID